MQGTARKRCTERSGALAAKVAGDDPRFNRGERATETITILQPDGYG